MIKVDTHMDKKFYYLESVDVFQDLSQIELEAVSTDTRMVKHTAGHLFYMPDDPGEVLFILKEGRVQLYRMSTDGRKLVFAELHPGAIFGHMALVGQRLHQMYAQAIDDCLICVWNREQVERMMVEKPHVALRFLEAVGHRLTQVEERLTEATFQRIPARLASLLLRLDEETGHNGRLQGYTHQYLADMLGTYRETTTQILNEFKGQGLIQIGRKSIKIMDEAGLEDVVST